MYNTIPHTEDISRESLMKEEEVDKVILNSTLRKATTTVVDKNLHIPDPHDIVLIYFEEGNVNPMTEGSLFSFKLKLFGVAMFVFALKFLGIKQFPSLVGWILIPLISWLIIEILFRFVYILNNASKKGLFHMASVFALITAITVIFGALI